MVSAKNNYFKRNFFIVTTLVTIAVVLLFIFKNSNIEKIDSFDRCAQAGYPVMESFPEQCRTPDGRTFIRKVAQDNFVIQGMMVCLPHRDQSGPQTLECAFGLQDENGAYYALSDTDPEYKNISGIPMNKEVEVTGTFTAQNGTKYQSIGIIEVVSVTLLE